MAIIRRLDLRRAAFEHLTSNGHFGENALEYAWERTDLVRELNSAFRK